MEKLKKIGKSLIKVLNSKVLVVIAIGLFLFGGLSNMNAKAEEQKYRHKYSFGIAYQYYLLRNQQEDVVADGSAVAGIGNVGSGGVSGKFSYSDLVNGAPNKTYAKQFAQTYATYAAFNYISTSPQGFKGLTGKVGRFLIGIPLIILGVTIDALSMLYQGILGLLVKFNVIMFFANIVAGTKFSSEIASALGYSTAQLKTFLNMLFSIAVLIIVATIVVMLSRGGRNIQKKDTHRLKGRLFSLIAFPVVIFASATLINEVASITSNTSIGAGYSRYMVDVRSWAFNYNFSPTGSGNSATDVQATNGYIDTSFDPYTGKAGDRINAINEHSSLFTQSMPNTSVAIAYMLSYTFGAQDYIDYLGSPQSKYFYATNTPITGSTNSYYDHAKTMAGKTTSDGGFLFFSPENVPALLDVKNSWTPSGVKITDGGNGAKGPFEVAIDDYKTKNSKDEVKLVTSPSATWRDRYIFGSKNGGKLMDKYYHQFPSDEQVWNAVGSTGTGKNGTVPSDASMFYILSTSFNETGGEYYIQAPARGIMGSVAQFDSSRSDYYVVSMVGFWPFTLLAMIASPLITLVILIALVTVLGVVGFLDMNIKPLKAGFKGMTKGDIEYAVAFFYYAVGLVGTVILFVVAPELMFKIINGIAEALTKAIATLAQGSPPTTAESAMSVSGVAQIISSLGAILFAFAYFKNKNFRTKFHGLISLVWDSASEAGGKMEAQAEGTSYRKISKTAENINIRQKKFKDGAKQAKDTAIDTAANVADIGGKVATGNWGGAVKTMLHGRDKSTSNKPDSGMKPSTKEKMDYNDVLKNTTFNEADRNLEGIQSDTGMDASTVKLAEVAQNSLGRFRENQTQENFDAANDALEKLKNQMEVNGEDQDEIDKVAADMVALNSQHRGLVSEKGVLKKLEKQQELRTGSGSPTATNPDSRTTNQVVNEDVNIHTTTNRVLNEHQLKSVTSSLGKTADIPSVQKAISRLEKSQTEPQLNKGIKELKRSIADLDKKQKASLNKDRYKKELRDLQEIKNKIKETGDK